MARIVIAYGEHSNETLSKRRARQVIPVLKSLGHEVVLCRIDNPNSPHRIVQAVLRAPTRAAAFRVLDELAAREPGLVTPTLHVTAGMTVQYPDAHVFNFHTLQLAPGAWEITPTTLAREDRALVQQKHLLLADYPEHDRVGSNLENQLDPDSGASRTTHAAAIQYSILRERGRKPRVAALVENSAEYVLGPTLPGARMPVLTERTRAALGLMRDWYTDRHPGKRQPKAFKQLLADLAGYTRTYTRINSRHPLAAPEFAHDLAHKINELVIQAENENPRAKK